MEDITQQCWYVFIPLEAMLSAVLAGICLRLSLRPIRSRIVSKWGKKYYQNFSRPGSPFVLVFDFTRLYKIPENPCT